MDDEYARDDLSLGASFGHTDGAGPLYCVICGQPLTGDPEDQPDWPTGPMCGECYRGQQTDDDMAVDEGV